MATGWIIGVLLDAAGEPEAVRHYFAVGQADQARAEWAATDRALAEGSVSTSPKDGVEPVEAVGALAERAARGLGLRAGEVRSLGRAWPRRWLAGKAASEPADDRALRR
jgi:hypothetical protein